MDSLISVETIMAATAVLQQKEAADGIAVSAISSASFETLQATLIQWGIAGFPTAYPLLSISLQPPARCSDGAVRELSEYVVFCSGKSLAEHVQELQAKLKDITVSYANILGDITILVSRVV
jgi:hypothetical protein